VLNFQHDKIREWSPISREGYHSFVKCKSPLEKIMVNMLEATAEDVRLTAEDERDCENVLQIFRDIERLGLSGKEAGAYVYEEIKRLFPNPQNDYYEWFHPSAIFDILLLQNRLVIGEHGVQLGPSESLT